MGSWFSNLHIRKREGADPEAVAACLREYMRSQHYESAASAEDADGALAIVADDEHPWVSVYSDLLTFEDPGVFGDIAAPISGALGTDVLGIACFDSDYLYLNLINQPEKLNAWVGVGSAAGLGIKRRTGLAAWKRKVADHGLFAEAAKQKYVFAEEFLTEAESCLELPPERSCASYEYLKDLGLQEKARIFYYKLPEDQKSKELPVLTQWTSSLDPCWLEKSHWVAASNVGGESRGLSVYFVGPYVEHDEITFSDIWLFTGGEDVPTQKNIELKKVQLSDGQWAYWYHDPGFRIPPKVDERLPEGKKFRLRLDREIYVRFIPHGNPRKLLDIAVVFVPDKNPAGQVGWIVWQYSGSKEAYIEERNKSGLEYYAKNRSKGYPEPKLLNREDFD